jgi:hypothetical protein
VTGNTLHRWNSSGELHPKGLHAPERGSGGVDGDKPLHPVLRYASLYDSGTDGGVDFNQDDPPRHTDFAYLGLHERPSGGPVRRAGAPALRCDPPAP